VTEAWLRLNRSETRAIDLAMSHKIWLEALKRKAER
jgi:hypothetical protein